MLHRILALLLVAPAAMAANDVHEFTLDNGLKLIVKEDHRAPVVVSQVWYKVGSSYEHNGITGISHVLEHMMFKGTQKHPPGDFSRIIAANGGQENAFTGRDYTAYFQSLQNDRLKVSFELEADRMRNLSLAPKEFDKEVHVVMEERRLRTEDDPQSLTYEHFNASAYMVSPYRHPVIGWMEDLVNLKAGDLKPWYRRWYAPNNATLVVVGDVQPQAVLALAKKYFGPLKPEKLDPVKPRREPPQIGEQRLTVRAPAQLPYLMMGYKTPVVGGDEPEWEPYALEVLAGILDGGDSARLASQVVRGSGIAASASADYSPYSRLSTMLMLDGTPATGQDVAAVEKALREQVQRLRDEPVSADELQRVKAQVVAHDVYQRDSLFYQAMQIGTLETIGLDWHLMDQYVDRISAVTAEQVQQVARKYLTDEHLTVAVLEPEAGAAPPRRRAPSHRLGGAHES